MIELSTTSEEAVATIPTPLLVEKGSEKILNKILHRLHGLLSASAIGGILGGLGGFLTSSLVSMSYPEAGLYNLIPMVVGVGVGGTITFIAGLRHPV